MDRKTELGAPLVGRLLSDSEGRKGGSPAGPGKAPDRLARMSAEPAPPTLAPSVAQHVPHPEEGQSGWRGPGKPARAKKDHRGERKPGPRKARPLTATRIRNISENYIGQRECSVHMLRQVLERRLDRYLREAEVKDADAARREAASLIEDELVRVTGIGLVDDARFAEMKARNWLGSGRGARRILMDLARKGIDGELARSALTEASREMTGIFADEVEDREALRSAEWEAADKFAQKKRIGCHRRSPLPEDGLERRKIWRREASAMARAGFEMDVIYQFLDAAED